MPTNRAPRFSPGLSQAELQRGYEKIGNRSPIRKADVQKAYQPYRLKLSPSRGKASDAALFKQATKAVIDWYKRQQAAGKPSTAAPAPAATRRVAGGMAMAGQSRPAPSFVSPPTPARAPRTLTYRRGSGTGGARLV